MKSSTLASVTALVDLIEAERDELFDGILADNPGFEAKLDTALESVRTLIAREPEEKAQHFIQGRAALLLRVINGAQSVIKGKPRDELVAQHAWDTLNLSNDLLALLGLGITDLESAAKAEGPNPVITTEITGNDEQKDDGWYWYCEHSRCDTFGPFATQQRARDAGKLNQTDPD